MFIRDRRKTASCPGICVRYIPGSKARQKGELVIVIGEKINGSIASVRQAIDKKDPTLIAQLAKAQADAKADYLDICAGTEEDIEVETLKWMVRIVQDAVDARICIDLSLIHISEPTRLGMI